MHAARIVSHGCDADEWPCCTVWAISATTLVAEGAVKIGCEKLLSRRFFPCCRCRAPCEKPAVRKSTWRGADARGYRVGLLLGGDMADEGWVGCMVKKGSTPVILPRNLDR